MKFVEASAKVNLFSVDVVMFQILAQIYQLLVSLYRVQALKKPGILFMLFAFYQISLYLNCELGFVVEVFHVFLNLQNVKLDSFNQGLSSDILKFTPSQTREVQMRL